MYLLLLQDRSKCTKSELPTPYQPNKEIVFKDLKKVWDDHQFKIFNAKNTLLVDDSPYKALLNPVSQLFIFLVLVSQLFLLIC